MKRHAYWDSGQLRTFLCGTGDDPLHTMFMLMGVDGLRLQEALGLRWFDVDLEKAALHVTGPEDEAAESGSHGRTVDLGRGTAELLWWHGCRQRLQRWQADFSMETDLVFTRLDGSGLNPRSVQQRFRDLVLRAGLPHIQIDDLRLCAELAPKSEESVVHTAH